MNATVVEGVDPGLVHTGVVLFQFFSDSREVLVDSKVVDGPDAGAVRQFSGMYVPTAVFIEGYRPRSHFGTDERMVKAVAEMHREIPGSTVLNNTGVKKVVKPPLMRALKCWDFSQTTHHQDLRSAARIALLGMMRDEDLNWLLSDVVRDYLDGRSWNVLQQS